MNFLLIVIFVTIRTDHRTKGLRIGYGMVARGEIVFITAGIGLAVGVINDQIYSTMIVVVLATIFIAPTMLRLSYRKNKQLT